jgi:hypothetical protein
MTIDTIVSHVSSVVRDSAEQIKSVLNYVMRRKNLGKKISRSGGNYDKIPKIEELSELQEWLKDHNSREYSSMDLLDRQKIKNFEG